MFIPAPSGGAPSRWIRRKHSANLSGNMASLKGADGAGGLAGDNQEDASGQAEFDELLHSNVLDTLVDL